MAQKTPFKLKLDLMTRSKAGGKEVDVDKLRFVIAEAKAKNWAVLIMNDRIYTLDREEDEEDDMSFYRKAIRQWENNIEYRKG